MDTARAGAAVAVVAALAFPGAAHAQQGTERITRYDVAIDVAPSGRIHVVETIAYSFGAFERHGIMRHVPVRFRYDDKDDRVYPLTHVHVTASPGTPTDTEVSTASGSKVIRIGDPDRTISGTHTYVISYDVDGALNRFESHDELFWNAVGTEWDVPIAQVRVRVTADATVGEVTCFAGPEGSRLKCRAASADGDTATFANGPLGPGSGVSVVVALPAGYAAQPGPILKERWSADRAFARSPLALGLGALVLALGLFWVVRLSWRTGRDRRFAGLTPGLEPATGTTVPEAPVPLGGSGAVGVEWRPDDDMRPALMGVLVDERADPLDVTATIVDLAVRRFLTIEELPRHGFFGKRDWRLTYLMGAPTTGLTPWEQRLLTALFARGETVDVSDLKNEFHAHLVDIQSELYDDVVARGWFTTKPDAVRTKWNGYGVLAVAVAGGVTFLLARFTHLGLVGVATVVPALLLLALHNRMPARTARGTAALDRARGFRRYLATAEAEQLKFEESAGIFARYLPYAVVLGETERWAKAFKDLGAERDLYWYSGPHGWSAMDFSDSMSSFSTMTAGTLSSTPSSAGGGSGFSGGSSGGGGGGGGGGSW